MVVKVNETKLKVHMQLANVEKEKSFSDRSG